MVVVAVFKISSKYVGIIRLLATRRTLGKPKLLKYINKAQPEPCYKKHSSGAEPGTMLTKTESSGAGAISFLQELGSPELKMYNLDIMLFIIVIFPRWSHALKVGVSTLFCQRVT